MQVETTILTVESSLRKVLQALRRRLTFDDNIQCQIIRVSDTGGALTPFTVTHSLGKVPIGYIVNSDKHGTVRDVNRSGWTNQTMQLESSAANASLTLIVF